MVSDVYSAAVHSAAAQNEGHAELKATAARMEQALRLILLLAAIKTPHLGYVRRSGINQGCICCIASLALGNSMECTTADDFSERREQIMSDLHDHEHKL